MRTRFTFSIELIQTIYQKALLIGTFKKTSDRRNLYFLCANYQT